MSLTVSSFFQYFMFNPSELPKRHSRLVALVSTVAIGVFTLGLTHLICYLAFYQRRVVPVNSESAREADRKVQEIAEKATLHSNVKRKKKRRTKKGLKHFSPDQLPAKVKYENVELKFSQMKQDALGGNVEYQLHIGKLFLLGKSGFPLSNSNAFYWYNKAAESDSPLGMYRAGKMYYRGYGVKKDKARGVELLQQAADAGQKSARSYLLKIKN